MTTVTLTFKGQLMILRQLRDTLGLAAAARPRSSIDRQGRLVLVPSNDEQEDLFRHRPAMQRTISLDDMQQAISAVDADDGVQQVAGPEGHSASRSCCSSCSRPSAMNEGEKEARASSAPVMRRPAGLMRSSSPKGS